MTEIASVENNKLSDTNISANNTPLLANLKTKLLIQTQSSVVEIKVFLKSF